MNDFMKGKITLRRFLIATLSVILLILVIACVTVRFQNPDLTQMRVLINNWRLYVFTTVIAVIWCIANGTATK